MKEGLCQPFPAAFIKTAGCQQVLMADWRVHLLGGFWPSVTSWNITPGVCSKQLNVWFSLVKRVIYTQISLLNSSPENRARLQVTVSKTQSLCSFDFIAVLLYNKYCALVWCYIVLFYNVIFCNAVYIVLYLLVYLPHKNQNSLRAEVGYHLPL